MPRKNEIPVLSKDQKTALKWSPCKDWRERLSMACPMSADHLTLNALRSVNGRAYQGV